MKLFLTAAILGAIFVAGAITLLANGHLQEDAYILFQYSKKLALGKGIVFDDISGPTEGATDFLWMVILALIHRLGLDLGSASALLNGIGLAATSYVIFKLRGRIDYWSINALLVVIFSGGLAAALGGFSTLAYGGLFSIFVYCLLQKKYKVVSVLFLLIPLFRPDGVLLVIGGGVVLLFISAEKDRKFFLYLLVPVFIGICYFFWRIYYFGMILPLPLLVKARTDRLFEGVYSNFLALRLYLPLLIPFILLVLKKGWSRITLTRYFAVGLGSFLLLIALSFAHQSQNVGYRLQYPIVLSLVFIFLITIQDLGKLNKKFMVILLLPVLIGAKIIYENVRDLTNNDYINSFPQALRERHFNVDKIAITEAGRFPFWYDASEMIDLVGLNSAKVVRDGAAKVLNESNPGLIFVHHANRFEISKYQSAKPFIVIDANLIKLRSAYLGKNTVSIAPEAALAFAIKNSYSAILVKSSRADDNFSHVYFLSPNLSKELFITALEDSITNHVSYFQSKQDR